MNVLIVGSGGREYSIGLALKRDEKVDAIFFAPGNGATEDLGENVDYENFDDLVKFAKESGISLTIVGPEAPLVDGIVDLFKENGLRIFGPSKEASRLEGSKVFMKDFLKKYNIPTAKYLQSDNFDKLKEFAQTLTPPIVVKADGLCAGKGVIIAQSEDEALKAIEGMLSGESFGDAGKRVIVEEFLDGYELSVFAICDGEDYKILPAAQDHKRLLDGDKGPNTGGMGAYAPTPLIDEKLYKEIEKAVVIPTLDGMKREGSPFEGVLFMGLMIVDGEVKVLEYNVRFGDPECEILMPLIQSSVYELFYKGATKDLKNLDIEISDKRCVGVVLASKDYPYKSSKPAEIIINKIDSKELLENSHISYAGVSKIDGKLFATGGRVMVCVGVADSIKEARERAYDLVGHVHFMGKQCRMDIAYQALK